MLKKLNKDRKKQAQQIDILCNDLIGAQRNFIKRLNTISFIASFCESIIGTIDLNNLLYTAARIIKTETADASVIFFLREGDDFQLHAFESAAFAPAERGGFESCFSPELMDNICKSNKVCTLDDMVALGLEANPSGLNQVSAVSIPLGLPGSSLGFMLLYRSSEEKLTADEIERIFAVTYGLSRAVALCRAPSGAAE
ncbi:MAG: hypothetical protein JSW66_14560 [Phycisphaerales bacterium]|nr:MAG: hypothetical protein JSW66_14560 [Phycisphaerales bacterium]